LDDFQEPVGVMRRLHDALERVAAGAVEQESLLLVRAWHAHQTFGVGEMSGEVLHLPEVDLDVGFLTCSDGRAPGSVELIAGGARLQCVMSRLKSLSREGKSTASVADNADADCRPALPGGDHHAFHRTFLCGGHVPRQR